MKSIVIIGSNLIGMLCADILSKNNNVTIIEPDLELGFPSSFPGRSKNETTISEILINQSNNNLFLMKDDNFTNFRSEWFSKLLTHKLAKNNVEIKNRSRISSITETEDLLKISIKGSDNNQKKILCNTVIDFSKSSFSIIGNSQHEYDNDSTNIIKPQIKTKQHFVGICLLKDSQGLVNFETKIQRNDGLVEIWFEFGKQQQPNQGWIESKIVDAYFDSKLMLLEDYYSKAQEIVKQMVIK